MASLNIRGLERAEIVAWKLIAKSSGMTLRDGIIKAIREWVSKETNKPNEEAVILKVPKITEIISEGKAKIDQARDEFNTKIQDAVTSHAEIEPVSETTPPHSGESPIGALPLKESPPIVEQISEDSLMDDFIRIHGRTPYSEFEFEVFKRR